MINNDLTLMHRRFAADIRIEALRAMHSFGSGHVGGSMSIADALAVLYGSVMKYDANNPLWEERDRLVMSKGHCGPALYAALALKGFFPIEKLSTLNQPGTILPSHCDRLRTPGIDISTGSLGQGASLACGLAMAGKMKKQDHIVYGILGDGELQEGEVWEAFQLSAARGLDNLVYIIDRNKMQLDGFTEDISPLEPLKEKLEAFRFEVKECDGHNVDEIYESLSALRVIRDRKPKALILHTEKGAGYLAAERAAKCHFMSISDEDFAEGISEIERRFNEGLPVCGEVNR